MWHQRNAPSSDNLLAHCSNHCSVNREIVGHHNHRDWCVFGETGSCRKHVRTPTNCSLSQVPEGVDHSVMFSGVSLCNQTWHRPCLACSDWGQDGKAYNNCGPTGCISRSCDTLQVWPFFTKSSINEEYFNRSSLFFSSLLDNNFKQCSANGQLWCFSR